MTQDKQQIESAEEKTNVFSIESACKSHNLIKNLRFVIESHPDETAKNFGMSIMHLIYDNYDKMLACLEFIAQQHPDIPLIQRRIAEIHIHRNDFHAAIPFLEKVLELEEEDMTAKVWLSLSYFVTGNEKKAKSNLKCLKGHVFMMYAANSNWLD